MLPTCMEVDSNLVRYKCFASFWCDFYTLLIVRWDYTAKNRSELSVRRGDEVEIIEQKQSNNYWKV